MTAKQKVQKRYPNAIQWHPRDRGWEIYSAGILKGMGRTEGEAWRNAAKNLSRRADIRRSE